MISLPLFKKTVTQTLKEPAIIFVIILQCAILLFISFGIRFEFHNNVLTTITLFGKNNYFDADLIAFRMIVENISLIIWYIFVFLYIIGTGLSFSEIFHDPTLNIILTKNVSRSQILLTRYLGVVSGICLLQFTFATLLSGIVFAKSGQNTLWLIQPITLAPTVNLLILSAMSSFLAIIFYEQNTVVILFLLIVYFLQPLIWRGIQLDNPIVKIAIYLFPPFNMINRYYYDILLTRSTIHSFPFYCFFYSCIFIVLAILIFQRKDLS